MKRHRPCDGVFLWFMEVGSEPALLRSKSRKVQRSEILEKFTFARMSIDDGYLPLVYLYMEDQVIQHSSLDHYM